METYSKRYHRGFVDGAPDAKRSLVSGMESSFFARLVSWLNSRLLIRVTIATPLRLHVEMYLQHQHAPRLDRQASGLAQDRVPTDTTPDDVWPMLHGSPELERRPTIRRPRHLVHVGRPLHPLHPEPGAKATGRQVSHEVPDGQAEPRTILLTERRPVAIEAWHSLPGWHSVEGRQEVLI